MCLCALASIQAAAPCKAVWEDHNVAFVEAVSQRCWFNSVVIFEAAFLWRWEDFLFPFLKCFILVFLLLVHTMHIFINCFLWVWAAHLVQAHVLKLHDMSHFGLFTVKYLIKANAKNRYLPTPEKYPLAFFKNGPQLPYNIYVLPHSLYNIILSNPIMDYYQQTTASELYQS